MATFHSNRTSRPPSTVSLLLHPHSCTHLDINQIKVGDIVLLNQARVAVVRYIGSVDGKSTSKQDHFIGVEIRITDGAVGDNNGSYNQKTYFQCAQNCGLFIEPTQILQIYSPEVNIYTYTYTCS